LSFVPGTTGADDDNGHGTVLAGIIGAQDNNIGIVGVAPGAEIYAVKVIGRDGNGDTSAVVKGIKWSIANQMQIINLSFGDPNQLPGEVVNALQEAYEAGILIIAGAGNSGRNGSADSICYPAKYDMVLSVGSTDQYNIKSEFSSTGPRLDVVAPGQNITSCNNQGGYSISSGTSNSAAYVTGVAALLISNGVSDNQVIKQILESGAIDLGAPGYDTEYGYGLINAEKAISLMLH
jgi:minor extracellular protease Epr